MIFNYHRQNNTLRCGLTLEHHDEGREPCAQAPLCRELPRASVATGREDQEMVFRFAVAAQDGHILPG